MKPRDLQHVEWRRHAIGRCWVCFDDALSHNLNDCWQAKNHLHVHDAVTARRAMWGLATFPWVRP